VTIGRQQLKILLIRWLRLSFKYNLKANGVRMIIFGISELKKSYGRHFLLTGHARVFSSLVTKFVPWRIFYATLASAAQALTL
jgi:hypothetical protein